MKKIFHLLLLIAAMTIYTGCTPEVDDAFSESSAQRMTDAINSTKKTLQEAPNGWLMRMYGDLDFGGYNVLCKFEGDYVTVMNEVYGNEDTAKSHYKVDQSAGVILSFDEYNEMFHFFSDPANPAKMGQNGLGFQGDLEFRVLKATADSIIMVGKKHDARIVMTPAPADWAGYLDKVYDMEEFISAAKYMLTVDGKEMPTVNSYRLLQATDKETGVVTEMPYIVTDKGIELYEPVTINGKTVKAFNCTGESWPEVSDNTVTLAPVIMPINEQFTAKTWYITYSNVGPYGKPYWNEYLKGETAVGKTLISATFGRTTLETANTFGYQFQSDVYRGALYWTYQYVGSDQITITFSGKADSTPGNGAWYWSNAKLNYGLYPFGTDQKPRTFKLETDNLANPTYILMTDVTNPNNWFKLSAKQVNYPFDN